MTHKNDKPYRMLLMVLMLIVTLPSHALYNEEMVLAGTPEQGATFSFTPVGGEAVEGTVKEDEEGNRVVAFPLPGNGPSSGAVTIDSDAGTKTIVVPPRGADEKYVLDVEKGVVTTAVLVTGHSALASSDWSSDPWEVSIRGGALYVQSDYFENTIDDQTQILEGILQDSGVTGINTRGSADDDSWGWSADVMVFYRAYESGSFYGGFGYGETGNFDGRSRGSGDFQGSSIEADGRGKSELDFTTLSLGYEYRITPEWRGALGLGVLFADLEDESKSVLDQNGIVVSSVNGSSHDNDEAAFVEASLSYLVEIGKRRSLEMGLALKQTDDLFEDEPLTLMSMFLGLRF